MSRALLLLVFLVSSVISFSIPPSRATTVNIDSNMSTLNSNLASATGNRADPLSSVYAAYHNNDRAQAFVNPTQGTQGCDMQINKTISPGQLQSPGTLTITLTIENVGSSACVGSSVPLTTTVTDTLPNGVTVSPSSITINQLTGSGWSCPSVGQTVTCSTSNAVPPNQPITITFTATVTGNWPSGLNNCATVGNGLDPSPQYNPSNPGNNWSCAYAKVTTLPTCDMAINKTMTPNPLVSGAAATITLTVWNNGTAACGAGGAAFTTSVTDSVPAGLTINPPIVVNPPDSWACVPTSTTAGPATVTCTITTLTIPPSTQSNPFVTVTIPLSVTASAGAIIRNCAHVSLDPNFDQNPDNNESCESIPVIATTIKPATICVSKFNDKDGDGVQNVTEGESNLSGWKFQITDSSGNLIATLTSSDGTVCVSVPPGTYTVSEVQQSGWTQTSPQSPGTYTVTVLPSGGVTLSFGNSPCDRAITKTIQPASGPPGQIVTITLTITNNGKAICPAYSLESVKPPVYDELPAGMTPTGAVSNPTGWNCQLNGTTLYCGTIPAMPAQNQVIISFNAVAETSLKNCAIITSDVNLVNNEACATYTVPNITTVSITTTPITYPTPSPIPGFSIEAILIGLVAGLVVLTLIRRGRNGRSR